MHGTRKSLFQELILRSQCSISNNLLQNILVKTFSIGTKPGSVDAEAENVGNGGDSADNLSGFLDSNVDFVNGISEYVGNGSRSICMKSGSTDAESSPANNDESKPGSTLICLVEVIMLEGSWMSSVPGLSLSSPATEARGSTSNKSRRKACSRRRIVRELEDI